MGLRLFHSAAPISRFAYKQSNNGAEIMRAKIFAINYGNYNTTFCAKKSAKLFFAQNVVL